MSTTAKKVTELEAERRALSARIRAAKRAEKKAAAAALLDAKHALGVRLAQALGADTLKAVEQLHELLDSDHMARELRALMWSDFEAGIERSGPVEGGQHDAPAW